MTTMVANTLQSTSTVVARPNLDRLQLAVEDAVVAARPRMLGEIVEVRGLSLVVRGLRSRVGDLVLVGEDEVPAEVVAVQITATGQLATCMPMGVIKSIGAGDQVIASGGPGLNISVGEHLLGRVLDGLGRPMDGMPLPPGLERVGVDSIPPDAMTRRRVDEALPLGIRAVDTLTPIGRGQRMGIFAGSGVGKSSLMSMITRGTQADVTVIALVGERGREVREFLDDDLGPEGLRNAVVVVATSDQPPLVRLRAAFVATRIAESFRDNGREVLLLMDSITRLAMAQREIGSVCRRAADDARLPPAVGVRDAAATARTGGHLGSRFDHRAVHRPRRRR